MIFKKNSLGTEFSIFILDLIVTAISFIFAIFLRLQIIVGNKEFLFVKEYYLVLFIIVLLIWFIIFRTNHSMPILPHYNFKDIINVLIKKIILGIIILLSLSFLIKGEILSRLFIIIFGILNIAFLIIERRLFLMYKRRRFRNGKDLTRVFVMGNSEHCDAIKKIISDHLDWGLFLTGSYYIDKDMDNEKLMESLKTKHIDLIIYCISPEHLNEFNRSLLKLLDSGYKIMLYIGDLLYYNGYFIEYDSFLNYDFLSLSSNKPRPLELYIKYVFDKVFAVILLLILFPFLISIYFLLLIFNGSPVIFKQKRVGLNGEIFEIYKFRTMKKDADKIKGKYYKYNIMSGPVFKMENDPRVTRIGKILRRFSIDELPQLINILKGQMSFVGPRPPLPEEVKKYQYWQRRRLSMKPGLTCTWQISGRNTIDFIDWMYMDMEYIDHWSLVYDIIIMIKSIPAVIFHKRDL